MTLLLHRCGVSWFKGMYSSYGAREQAVDEGTLAQVFVFCSGYMQLSMH
jgi:hypothetical protein